MTWTTKLVADCMIDAVRWARRTGAPVGPADIRGSMPTFIASLDDHLDEGWGFPETAGDDDPQDSALVLPASAEDIQRLERALMWPGKYLVTDYPASAQMLSLWLRHKTQGAGKGFDGAVRKYGLSRGHAYRLRDRGLSKIAIGLTIDGERP